MNVLTVVVPASLDGVRVDKAVALMADISRSSVNALVEEGRVQIDGAESLLTTTANVFSDPTVDMP